MLFILCTEILAIAILNNKEIKVIDIPVPRKQVHTQQKISQYADDTTLFLHDENQVLATFDTIEAFSSKSGLSLNIEKTEAMWLGSFSNRKEKLFGFKWPRVIRFLGIYIGYDYEETKRWNWTNKLESFQKTLDCWRTRDLTIFGRIVIVKTIGLSKLIYSATLLPIPSEIVEILENVIDKFLWKGRKRRIKKDILQKPVSEGGVGQTNIKVHFEALKASWIPQILKQQNSAWSFLSQHYLNKYGSNLVILTFNFQNAAQFSLIKQIPAFYQEVVIAFNKSKDEKKPNDKTEFLNSVIWGNRNFIFSIKGKTQETLYNKHWIECGIMKMSDIISQEGRIKTTILSKKH